jgi:replicative DNA helicase
MDAVSNLEAEEHVLGAMLLTRVAIEEVGQILEPRGHKKFYRRSHGLLYQAMIRMDSDGQVIDPVTLCAFLEAHSVLAEVGGKDRVQELASWVIVASNAVHHAKIVREQWARRELATALQIPTEGVSADVLLEQAEQAIMDVRLRIESSGRTSVASMYELAENLHERVQNPPVDDGVPTPFSFLRTLKGGRLYILSGYTGDGKTVVAAQYATAAAKRGLRIGFFTIEMSKEELFDRLVASFGIPLREVESGRISLSHMEAYSNAIKEITGWKLDIIDDRMGNSTSFQRIQRLRHYDLVIIDHLHEITLEGKQDYRNLLEQEVHRITSLARQENVPVLLLSQMSRRTQGRPFPIPNLTMLRESGRIEQEAHMVCFVWRERDKHDQLLPEAWFIVAKNRTGPSGLRRALDFNGERMN